MYYFPLIQNSACHRTGATILRLNLSQALTGLDRSQQGAAVWCSSTTGRACSGWWRRRRGSRGRRRRRTRRPWRRRGWRGSTGRRPWWRGWRRGRSGRCLRIAVCFRSSWRRRWWWRRRGHRALLNRGSRLRRGFVVHGTQRSRRSHGTEQDTGKLFRATTARTVLIIRRVIIRLGDRPVIIILRTSTGLALDRSRNSVCRLGRLLLSKTVERIGGLHLSLG